MKVESEIIAPSSKISTAQCPPRTSTFSIIESLPLTKICEEVFEPEISFKFFSITSSEEISTILFQVPLIVVLEVPLPTTDMLSSISIFS